MQHEISLGSNKKNYVLIKLLKFRIYKQILIIETSKIFDYQREINVKLIRL